MTYDQLASCYSIKHGQSVTQRLKEMSRERRPVSLSEFIAQMTDDFEVPGANQVRAKPGSAAVVGAAQNAPWRTSQDHASGTSLQGIAAGGGVVPSGSGMNAPAVSHATNEQSAPTAVMKYADVSRGVQSILKEQHEPIQIDRLDDLFQDRFSTNITDIVGMSIGEYLQRKENIFDYNPERGTVFLQSAVLAGPPTADPTAVKDEVFVVREFSQLIEAMGPVVYISTLCGKFIQRNGTSVTSIINTRPLDLFKRHPSVFLVVGAGNVTLKKFEHSPDVQRLLDKPSPKALRIARAAEEAQLPVPDILSEKHVVEEFRRLILDDGTDSVYISSLCGRFLQRFKKPVTSIITCKPAEFLRKYPDVFVMTGGGNVGLREVLGPDAVSVPPPPPRVPKALREDHVFAYEAIQKIELTDEVFHGLCSRLMQGASYQTIVQRLLSVCRQIEQASFLALEEVVLGGAAGKGLLAAQPGPHAEVVLFVRQLPFRNFPQWLPHIFDTLAPVLEHQLADQRANKFKVEKDHLRFHVGDGTDKDLVLHLYLCPVFKSRDHLLECIRASPPAERLYFYPAMVKERNDLVGRQSQQMKALIRLMTWWASKQAWSSCFAAPSDWLVELIVIHACQQLQQVDSSDEQAFTLADKVMRVLEIFANFESIKVLWADSGTALYALQEIWRPLLSHEPLFMDPLNPYCNLVDVNSFDAHELATAAQPPDCFDVFKREAAQFVMASGGDDEGEDEEYEDAKESD
eukprot:CAMPEP_0172936166 /NCGR_PEP_ID=MMETSP1075-20121228/221881_1 /TAXON_ID=2916 /ORGANISM="Ceratium fusus, Strain PA161109" /LENGTH=743 /DNA_ID=CAMNT_0013797533 /DNA_START=211 /DNA_END=2442 /DNA_ORIENTATION=+